MTKILEFIGYTPNEFKKHPLATILNVIALIFIYVMVIVIIYQITLMILGQSPAETELLRSLVFLVLGLQFRNMFLLGKISGELSSLKRSFSALAEDFKAHVKRK